MKFIEVLSGLKSDYKNDAIIRKNGTLLLGTGKIPKSKHMIFSPLEQENIDGFLAPYFKYNFPKEFIELLRFSNGANLYNIKLSTDKFSFAHTMLVILGLPLTQPFNRPSDMEEPFDIRIENLARHVEIPEKWIKCAVWTEINKIEKNPTDIFVDSETGKVFACEKNQKDILYSWDSLDSCFCEIVNSFENLNEEYIMNI